jgi:hypothetical protein
MQHLRFPIGEFTAPEPITQEQIDDWIDEIASFPARLKELTHNLSDVELSWRYRPDGWNIKQVIHHCADSHMNSFIRFKLSLTEDTPIIKPYFEDKWAGMPDTTDANVSASIKLIEGLHARWVILLKSLKADELKKEFIHPEHGKRFSVAENIGVYAWHSNHHLAHIRLALDVEGQVDP